MVFSRWIISAALAASATIAVVGTQACSSSPTGSGFGTSGTSGTSDASGTNGLIDLNDGGNSEGGHACVNLECQRQACDNAATTTTLSGRVYDPAGKNPLYNVIVYVPNTDLQPITTGATCDKCGSLALSPVSVALTDENGAFTLKNIPVMTDMPVVIQVGKWRRQFTIPSVTACTENKVPDKMFSLPRNKAQGDIPQIALSTGGADPLGCVLLRAGIDAAEFTSPTGKGRVHVYKGHMGEDTNAGGAPDSQSALWDSVTHLKKYDLVMLSCEGSEYDNEKPSASKTAMRDYLNAGGRVFSTHYHYTWFQKGPADLASTATWPSSHGYDSDGDFSIDTSFPKGQSFAKWLKNVNASSNGSTLPLTYVTDDIKAASAGSQRWIYGSSSNAPVKYMSLNTPVGAKPEDQCGRAVVSALHVGNNGNDSSNKTMPGTCLNQPLSAQEKALLFMLMDLSSCVQDDKVAPAIPK